MKRSFDAAFPPRPVVDAAGAARQYPSWFLLDRNAQFADRENATTAKATTSTGSTIKFTFCLDPPPAVSYLFVHETDTHDDAVQVQAKVVCSAKDLVLLLLNADEYFVYQAAAGRGRSKPSLTPIPANLTALSSCAAILPLDDGHFLVADLTVDFGHDECHYRLDVFSSKTRVWSTMTLTSLSVLTRRDDVLDDPEKVIALGGSVLGWVVSRAGIVVWDVGQDPSYTCFIPLPKPDWDPNEEWRGNLMMLRDVAYCGDGFIRVLDIDFRFRHVTVDGDGDNRPVVKMARDFDRVDTILDSELLPDGVSWAATVTIPDGWKIRTCYRHISWNYWRKGHVVDADDIAIYDPRHCAMLPQLWDEGERRWTLKKLRVYKTTLSIHGDNMVYLSIVPKQGFREKKWIVGLDLGKKTVEMFEPDLNSEICIQPFTFSQHLNTPPSVEEIIHGASMARSNHVSSGCVTTQNNLQPLQQNMWNSDGYYNGSSYGYVDNAHAGQGYGNNQHPPTWSANLPQNFNHNLNSLRSACGPRSNHFSSGCVTTQNNLQPLQQNMWNADGYYNGSSYGFVYNAHPGHGYGNNQHPPTWSANLPQNFNHNLNSLRSGCVYPVNTQSMYPSHMVNTAAHGQQFYSMPLLPPGPVQASAPSSSFAPPWRLGQRAFRR